MNTNEVIDKFNKAIAIATIDYGTERAVDAQNAAFDAAKSAGWNYEEDDQFTTWALKSTDIEALEEGKRRFIKAIK